MISRALEILKRDKVNILGTAIPANLIPFNIVAVRPSRQIVSFMWYTGFWDSERPVRVYSLSVNLEKNTVKPSVSRSFTPAVTSRVTSNYLHHKEEFVHGIEALAINPYRNCKTLERRMREQRDEWVELPWKPVIICAGDIEDAVKKLESLASRLKGRRAKILIYVGDMCNDEFIRGIVDNLSCDESD